ncbi:hypothetical protein SCA_1526 [Staphylococcus carnosus subsp. carnosus TM300]|uniref:Uncharacterized protein n=1 Tax=Staphylococcus carnosus (strain TM300) TaxID=396513 RepID=B9DMN5_STACT|nr:hypothetical protein SCA_1526 [Staphylococcus carnosus subsp. carnosus TM300]
MKAKLQIEITKQIQIIFLVSFLISKFYFTF